jgi:hypothetical protein
VTVAQTPNSSDGNKGNNPTSAKARLGILAQLRAKKEHLDEAKSRETHQVTSKPHPTIGATAPKKLADVGSHDIIGKDSENLMKVPSAQVNNVSTKVQAKEHPGRSISVPVTSPDKEDAGKSSATKSPSEFVNSQPMSGPVGRSQQEPTKPIVYSRSQVLTVNDANAKSKQEVDSTVLVDRDSPEKSALPVKNDGEAPSSATPNKRLSKIIPGGSSFKAAYSNRNLFEQNVAPSRPSISPSNQSHVPAVPTSDNSATTSQSKPVPTSKSGDENKGKQNPTSAKARLGILAQLRAKKEHVDEAKSQAPVQVTSKHHSPRNTPGTSPDKTEAGKIFEIKSPSESASSQQMSGQGAHSPPAPTKAASFRRSQALFVDGLDAKASPVDDTAALASTTPNKRLSKIVPGGSNFKAAYSNRNLFEPSVSPSMEKASSSSTSPALQGQKDLSLNSVEDKAKSTRTTTKESSLTPQRMVQRSKSSDGDLSIGSQADPGVRTVARTESLVLSRRALFEASQNPNEKQ